MSNGKGSKRRPSQVPDSVVADNWARAFGKPSQTVKKTKPRPTKQK